VNPHLITATHENPCLSKVRLLFPRTDCAAGNLMVTGGSSSTEPDVTYCNPMSFH